MAESSDQFDKLDLLNHLAARMPVEQVSFQVMMSVVLICQESQQQTGREESQPARGVRYNTSNTEPVNYWALARGILPGKQLQQSDILHVYSFNIVFAPRDTVVWCR